MRNHEEKIDLLTLTPKERRRVCREIRAAIREKVAAAKVPTFWAFSNDAVIDMPTQSKSWKEPSFGHEDPAQNNSIWESLTRRFR